MRKTLSCAVALLALSLHLPSQTLEGITKENTSACSGTSGSELHCFNSFLALWSVSGMTNTNPYFETKLTPQYQPIPANVSGPELGNLHPISIRSLIPYENSASNYRATSTKVFAHFMPWFESTSNFNPSTSNYRHVPVGYVSDSSYTVDEQLRDLDERDYDGLIVFWVGQQDKCRDPATNDSFTTAGSYDANFTKSCPGDLAAQDQVVQKIASRVVGRGLQYALLIDEAGFGHTKACGKAPDGQPTQNYMFTRANAPACVEKRLVHDLQYAQTAYLSRPDSSYYKPVIAGAARPAVYTFIAEENWFTHCNAINACFVSDGTQCTDSVACWNLIWARVSAAADTSLIFRNNGRYQPYANGPVFLLGALHSNSQGMYGWIQPNPANEARFARGETATRTTVATQQDFGASYLQRWHGEARCTWDNSCTGYDPGHPEDRATLFGKQTVAGVYKGFDNYRAFQNPSLFPDRAATAVVMSQDCGNVWRQTWAKIGENFSAANPVSMVQVATWNDYDEGTAVEAGIENCFAPAYGNVGYNSNTLSWDLFSPGTGHLGTIDHFEIYYERSETPGNNLILLGDNVPVGNPTVYDPALDPNRRRPSRCQPGQCIYYQFSFDISSARNAHPGEVLDFYVKTIGKAGIVNKTSASISTDPVLRQTRAVRPSREASGSEEFMAPPGAESGIGSVSISGFTGYATFEENCQEIWVDGGGGQFGYWQTSCENNSYWDSGAISVTVNGFTKWVSYVYDSSPANLAQSLAQEFNLDAASPVNASALNGVLYMTSKITGASGNYSLTATASTYDPFHFPNGSYSVTSSGATLTGGN